MATFPFPVSFIAVLHPVNHCGPTLFHATLPLYIRSNPLSPSPPSLPPALTLPSRQISDAPVRARTAAGIVKTRAVRLAMRDVDRADFVINARQAYVRRRTALSGIWMPWPKPFRTSLCGPPPLITTHHASRLSIESDISCLPTARPILHTDCRVPHRRTPPNPSASV